MRRTLPLLLSLAALIIAALASVPFASAASRIQCRAATAIIPCCPVPTGSARVVPICCTGQAGPCPVSALTISSTPITSTAGRPVTITGRLFSGPSGPATVTLWQKLPGQTRFHQVRTTSTDSLGAYKFVLGRGVVRTNRDWYVTAQNLTSPTIVQRVRALVTLKASERHSASGRVVTLTGSIAPLHRGERVRLQRHTAHGWVTIATVRLSRASKFIAHVTLAGSVRPRVRALFGGDRRNVRSSSRALSA